MVGKKSRGLNLYLKELEYLIKKDHLSDNVKMIGEIGGNRLLSYYLGCDLFVCASRHEGFCIPVAEAQCFGLPVVARKSSAIPYTLGADQLLLSDDPVEYAAAIKLLSTNDDIREYLIQKGRENYKYRFDAAIVKDRFLRILSGFAGVRT
jgi:glycosyltransferase involved in cell wall biosynthesis